MSTESHSPLTDTNSQLWADFNRICDFGGRLAGSESEHSARHSLMEMGEAATGVACQLLDVPYQGWKAKRCELRLTDGTLVPSHPLVRSGATGPEGLAAEVVDLGRGTPEEFAAHAAEIPGRIVLVRHELMFAAGTIHRGKKFQAALDHGAAGFLDCGSCFGSGRRGVFRTPRDSCHSGGRNSSRDCRDVEAKGRRTAISTAPHRDSSGSTDLAESRL